MISLILGLIIFFGTHSISILNRRWRDQRLLRLGEPAWKGLYSLVSLLGFGLICYSWFCSYYLSTLLLLIAPGIRKEYFLKWVFWILLEEL